MNKEQEINQLRKILGNSCLWKQSKDLDCLSCEHFSAENHVCCSFGQKEAEMLYDAGYRKMDEVLKENQRLKHCCNTLFCYLVKKVCGRFINYYRNTYNLFGYDLHRFDNLLFLFRLS